MPFSMITRSDENEQLYPEQLAASMARVDVNFLFLCEQEGLVQPRLIGEHLRWYSLASIRQVALIYRLYRELELDLPALDVILHLRRQVMDLLEEMDDMERQARQRERSLLREIQILRQMLGEG